MREYETVYVVQPQVNDAQQTQINTKLKGIIERHGGRLFYTRNMGKKNLAYKIKKQTKGVYFCLDYVAQGGCVSEIERNLILDENVLRFLTVVKAQKIDVEARAAQIEALGEAMATVEEKEETQKESSRKEKTEKEEEEIKEYL